MLRLTIERPNTIGLTYAKEYNNYSEAEQDIENKIERLCDRGWEATELKGSTQHSGVIELTHDEAADIILINWETL